METMKLKWIVQGLGIFLASLVVTFLFITLFLEPIVQDAYQKGYDKGKNESCDNGLKFNQISEDWDNDCPFGDCVPKLNVNFSLNLN